MEESKSFILFKKKIDHLFKNKDVKGIVGTLNLVKGIFGSLSSECQYINECNSKMHLF